jgi:hypothetical protein
VPNGLDPVGEKGFGLAEGFVVAGFDAEEKSGIGGLERAGAPGKGDNGMVVSSVDVKHRRGASVPTGGAVMTRTLGHVVEMVAKLG